MTKTVNLIVTLLAGLALASVAPTCAPYLSEEGGNCPCKDGWKCCQEKCIPEGDECSTDGGTEDGTNGGCSCMEGWRCCNGTCILEDAECNGGGSQVCPCRDSLDGLDASDHEVLCYRKDYSCSALAPCDEGYLCDNHNRCICISLDRCGVACSGDCDCPKGTVCDPVTDTCRLPLICLDNSMCPDGLICRSTMDIVHHYTCQLPDGREVGEQCDRSPDCNSSICYTSVCLQYCSGNEDCPNGQLCSVVDHGEPGCVLETECGASCSGPIELCGEHGQMCMNINCRGGADCEGNCSIHTDRPLLGECLESEFSEYDLCGDDEFFIMPPSFEDICAIFKACWTDDDCPDPYWCLTDGLLDAPPPMGSGLCARRQNLP